MDHRSEPLLALAESLIDAALRAGADAADAAAVTSRSRSAEVRLGKVEAIEASESDDILLRVFCGQRVASVSSDAKGDVKRLAERAVAMARVSPEDPFATLADPDLLAREDIDLDLFDDSEPSGESLVEAALAGEEAALAVPGVSNSGGASASAGFSGLALATSAGFRGQRRRSGFSRSVSVVAGEGTGMERDYDFDSRIHFADLAEAASIGRSAGERTVRRLDPQSVPTGRMPIVFDPRLSRGLFGHVLSAINGATIARGTSFLKDRMGEAILPSSVTITDEPLLARRAGSRPFDGEGVCGRSLTLLDEGRLASWLLDSATARELGLRTNGRAARSAGGVSPSASNVLVSPGRVVPAELIAETGNGIYVTELIGSGVDMVTGDYSRGASGFLIENGVLTVPVSGFTIAGNLSEMLRHLDLADDLDERFSIVAPTVRVAQMTVAGR